VKAQDEEKEALQVFIAQHAATCGECGKV